MEFEKRRGQVVAGFAPVKARVRDDEFSACDEQSEEAERGDPVSDADEERMAGSNRSGRDGRDRSWDRSCQRRANGFQFRHVQPPAEATIYLPS